MDYIGINLTILVLNFVMVNPIDVLTWRGKLVGLFGATWINNPNQLVNACQGIYCL